MSTVQSSSKSGKRYSRRRASVAVQSKEISQALQMILKYLRHKKGRTKWSVGPIEIAIKALRKSCINAWNKIVNSHKMPHSQSILSLTKL